MTTEDGNNASDPKAKRSKIEVLLKDVVSSHILDDRQAFTEQYALAQPFPHCILPNVFQESFINDLIQEIKQNSKVNFKESDLFKFYQSIDLANLDENSSTHMPCVLQLRQVLYSNDWRHFIEQVSGLPPNTLNQQVDCACNCHISGCHLLCHDDVIHTRRISYILYLTDVDWKLEEGGALELYSADNDGLPTMVPSKLLLPTRNSMAFFAVEPGVSFHSVQEVLGDRPRLSLQGWYHANDPPDNIHDATLQRLKGEADLSQSSTYEPLEIDNVGIENDDAALSESDRLHLAQFMDSTYLQPKALKEMRASFSEDSSIQLRSFLNDAMILKIDLQETKLKTTDANYYEQGVDKNWSMTGPTHMQRFLEYHRVVDDREGSSATAAMKNDTLGDNLYNIRRDLLQSKPFARFLSILTGLRPTACKGHIRRFRPGLDYTVAHHGLLTESAVLDVTLCFVAGSGKQQVMDDNDESDENDTVKKTSAPLDEADVAWQSGDVGGFECYIEAEDDEDENGQGSTPADEYNQDDDTELLSVSAGFNTLSIVYRDPGTLRFVKYLSAKAPSSRWDVAMEYQIENEEEEGDDKYEE
ncbi:prolyl 3-hydroxylase ogfod1 [Mayamaea pseudoterrestris]|nr:prolyl 3-hydroxylase ogfod1 [Mayamaea pseudoterrestris]